MLLLNKSITPLCVVITSTLLSGCAVSHVTDPISDTVVVVPEEDQEQRTKVAEGRGAVEFYYLDRTEKDDESDPHRISDKKLAYPAKALPRLPVLFESGDAFLNHGPIKPGVETPTGQVLQPSFLLHGSLRTALQSFDDGEKTLSEQANRIDLHGNWHLSGTERLAFSIRPLDKDTGEFTGVNFNPSNDEGWHQESNGTLTRLFFEGEFGEIFPRLDPADSGTLDWGFSVGRQPVLLQDGILLNDNIDLIGVTRNSLILPGIPNMRITGIFAWNEVNRTQTRADKSANLFGLMVEADTSRDSTVALDMIYVDDDKQTDAWYFGASSIQRIGLINSAFRINASIPEDKDRETAAVDGGVILSAELSKTMHGSDNLLYFNTFWSIDNFTQAAHAPDEGPAVANLGILYSTVGMGRYSVPLGYSIADTLGSTLGYQMYLDGIRSQLIVEVGARTSTYSDVSEDAIGVAVRYQKAIGLRHLLRLDGFAASIEDNSTSYGGRLEWLIKF